MTKSRQLNKAFITGVTVAVMVVGGGLAACSDGESSTKEAGTDNSPMADSDTGAGESTLQPESASLPDGYPDQAAPIYQPSTVTMGTNMGEGWLVTIESDDDVEDIAESILDTYESMGADVTQTPFDDDGVGQIAGGNAGYGVIITYNTDTDKDVSSVSYNVNPQSDR